MFYSFPNMENIECEQDDRVSTNVELGASQNATNISIGGTAATIAVDDSRVNITVGQTVFKV
jgi:hypothetical protein